MCSGLFVSYYYLAAGKIKKLGFNGTLNNLLDKLNNIRLATLLEESKKKGKIKAVYQLEEMDEEEKTAHERITA